jgi:elongator complex protein 3
VETIILDIIDQLQATDRIDEFDLIALIRRHNKNLNIEDHHSKRKLLPYYLATKASDYNKWLSWGIDEDVEKRLLEVLRMKPRRTASGVATITVITKPWMCASDCLYCPNDLRMPKSYLSDEPACQRAERNYFDPYLQVASRLHVLKQMGHAPDKIELIVLGGTWSDYPVAYQIWFVTELFRALNDSCRDNERENEVSTRNAYYQGLGIRNEPDECADFTRTAQKQIDQGTLTFNHAVQKLYGENEQFEQIAQMQIGTLEELTRQHCTNESSTHRVVGLVVETRPDLITSEALTLLRQLGCTKIQMGIQSLDPNILEMNHRKIDVATIKQSFELLRLFGFKIHAHFMRNLYGSTPEKDVGDYLRFVTDEAYIPDEVKLYPCALVEGTGLCAHYREGTWQPYSEEDLIDVLVADTINTPPYIRISRMIRDISAHDIVAGNKKANLRQLVEERVKSPRQSIREIRFREIGTDHANPEHLSLDTLSYQTSNTSEYFIQWVTLKDRIAAFARLSLPHAEYVMQCDGISPVGLDEAMIREVHVYGKVAELSKTSEGAQHLGLGKQLVEAACDIAKKQGYRKINVISSVGTRQYYRNLGFYDDDLYQRMDLV